MLYAYRAVMAVGVGILYKVVIFLFVFCITGNQRLRFIPSKSQTIMPKSLTCGYSICVPDTFVVGYHTVPTHY